MKCSCGYEDGLDINGDVVEGEKGEFYYSTFARLERRKDRMATETKALHGCPACGRVFIDLSPK